jgi:hypothetical protein
MRVSPNLDARRFSLLCRRFTVYDEFGDSLGPQGRNSTHEEQT